MEFGSSHCIYIAGPLLKCFFVTGARLKEIHFLCPSVPSKNNFSTDLGWFLFLCCKFLSTKFLDLIINSSSLQGILIDCQFSIT